MNLENEFFTSEYNDLSRVLRINNKTPENFEFDFSLLCLDTELCFHKGWAFTPSWGYVDLDLFGIAPLGIHKLGIGILIFSKENGEMIYRRDHIVKEGNPSNLFSANPRELQYGSWYTLVFENECENIFNFSKDDVIYDLGANVGVFSRWVLNQCDVEKIYQFEPTPDLFFYLKSTFGHLEKVESFEIAVAGNSREDSFHIFENSVSNTLLDFNGKNETWKGSIKIKCVNLEEFVKENLLQLPTFLKIDIESSEYEALEGVSDKFFSTVRQIFLEYHDNTNGKILNLIKRFLHLGYRMCLRKGDSLESLSGVILMWK